MAISRVNALFAVRNIAWHGDTDVYPYPLENHWFHDAEESIADLLMKLDGDFDGWLKFYPLTYATGLSSVGYNGFRAATQIDSIWNAYLLALLLEIGPEIERARIPVDKGVVFSYRFKPSLEEMTLFDKDIGWYLFQKAALDRAASSEFVVSTDISDFYSRVYHHRLENALKKATQNADVVKRIMEISKRLSVGETSYGLPVGGQASRILAELLLNRTDRLLSTSRISFCRFVDDYYLFARTVGEAQSALVQLSEILLTNEGLTLARSKTRVLSKSEFLRSSPVAATEDGSTSDEAMAREFLDFRLAFDPYSQTAADDYVLLKEQLEHFDITGMLAKELRKSRIDEGMTRHLIKAMRYLQPELRDAAVSSVVRNLNLLYPIFPSVAILLHRILPDLSEMVRSEVFETLRALINEGSHIFLVPANLSYAIRILAYDRAEETDALLSEVYDRPRSNIMVKRDVILAMTRRGVDYWLSAQLKKFNTATAWERRALIVASYILSDEGQHWRRRVREELQDADALFMQWVGGKNSGQLWELPL
jgi:Reverse transcriptase (RNA-dependent DNA polymerase)